VARSWDREARLKATSVIDAVATNMMIAEPTREMRVPIGGIAHAGIRGISKVELRVDNGEWMPAELRTPLSGQPWVMWRYDWLMQKGKHIFTVRCFEEWHAADRTGSSAGPEWRHRVRHALGHALNGQDNGCKTSLASWCCEWSLRCLDECDLPRTAHWNATCSLKTYGVPSEIAFEHDG